MKQPTPNQIDAANRLSQGLSVSETSQRHRNSLNRLNRYSNDQNIYGNIVLDPNGTVNQQMLDAYKAHYSHNTGVSDGNSVYGDRMHGSNDHGGPNQYQQQPDVSGLQSTKAAR